jgi:hypothetical protein
MKKTDNWYVEIPSHLLIGSFGPFLNIEHICVVVMGGVAGHRTTQLGRT